MKNIKDVKDMFIILAVLFWAVHQHYDHEFKKTCFEAYSTIEYFKTDNYLYCMKHDGHWQATKRFSSRGTSIDSAF